MPIHTLAELSTSRYALLRSFRRDGTPVDTPIWFGLDGDAVLFRTKIGPKTKRLGGRRDVELAPCDYPGPPRPGATRVAGRATVLSGAAADRANRLLRRRDGRAGDNGAPCQGSR